MKKNSLVKVKPVIDCVMIDIIPHELQRYDTVGDWGYHYDNGTLTVRASKLPNDPDNEKALAVACHELFEALLCRSKGITQEQVDKFDKNWNEKYSNELGEPGDDGTAPYHREHCFATSAERLLIAAMGIPWVDYEDSIETLLGHHYSLNRHDLKHLADKREELFNATSKSSNSSRSSNSASRSLIDDISTSKRTQNPRLSNRK